MADIRSIIEEKLDEVERKENIVILHCVESGSRAWGFASPDSDYDVRFIYARPKDFYLKLEKTRDVIEWQLDETLDINGWDLQKTLRLLHGSNPTIFEWNASPIVYRTTDAWRRVSSVINEYFVQKSGLYHYLSMAKTNYREHLKSETVRLKKYFYVLRPILACKWILDRGTPPPMLFKTLWDSYTDSTIRPDVERLLDIKTNSPEISVGARIDAVNAYIENNLTELEAAISSIPSGGARDWQKLNGLFLSVLDGAFKA